MDTRIRRLTGISCRSSLLCTSRTHKSCRFRPSQTKTRHFQSRPQSPPRRDIHIRQEAVCPHALSLRADNTPYSLNRRPFPYCPLEYPSKSCRSDKGRIFCKRCFHRPAPHQRKAQCRSYSPLHYNL